MAQVTPPAPTGGGTSKLSIESIKLIWSRGEVGNYQRDVRLPAQPTKGSKIIRCYPSLAVLGCIWSFLDQPVEPVRCIRQQQIRECGKNNAPVAFQNMGWIDHN